MTKPKTNPLGNITNLVFQGGGVKGVAYLGVLQQLQLERSNFLDGVKRIAGASAGSIVALYLGLNMSVDEIAPLMERQYSSLLDDGLVLKVKLDQAWYDTGVLGWIKKPFCNPSLDHLNFKAKHIVLHALKYFEDWAVKIDNNPDRLLEQEKELQEAINKIFKYYGAKMGFLPQCAIKFKGSKYASDAARWLVNLLHPPKNANVNEESKTSDLNEENNEKLPVPVSNFSTPQKATKTHDETCSFYTTESRLNPHTSDQYPNPHEVEQENREEKAQGRQAQPASFLSSPQKIDEKSIASGVKSGADVFEEVVKSECSGTLSESDKSELSGEAEIFASFCSSIKPRNLSHQSSFPSSLMSVLRNLTPDIIENNADKQIGHFCRSNSTDLEKAGECSGCRFRKTGKRSQTLERFECSSKADLENGSYEHWLPENLQDGKGITRSGNNVEVLIAGGEEEIKVYDLNEISKEAANAFQKEPCEISQKNVTKGKEEAAEEYLKRKRTIIAAAPEAELTDEILPAALGELLWFCIFSQQNAAGIQEQLGLFDGSVVKKELIEKPIMDSLLKLNPKPESNITFKELMDYKKFKQFYITAFNTKTSKTEVFSAEHTPNVVIADAVRASISIPVFFTPVTIREKYQEDGKIKYRQYLNGVNFMDGGILDNYPMWIFDDIKYCFDEDFRCDLSTNFHIQNPNTLGFRLLDGETIEKYTNPKFVSKTNPEEENQFKETFSYQIGLLLNAVANEAQENEHLKGGHYKRSVYVNNNGVSPIAFNLSDTERDGLVRSGKKAVKNYQKRAKNNFYGEGSTH